MLVSASTLSEYNFCPRAIYLRKSLGFGSEKTEKMQEGLMSHLVRKELSLRQAKIIRRVKDVEEIGLLLNRELAQIIKEIPTIYKERLEGMDANKLLAKIEGDIKNELQFQEEHLAVMVDELGLKETLTYITPWKVEYPLRSEILGLSGRIDKIYRNESESYPVEIKTGTAPKEYTWEGDRIQVGAYALLLEEKLAQTIRYAKVEYTQSMEQRPVNITEKLRRLVFETRDNVTYILEEKIIPEICVHGQGKKCHNCGYKEKCYSM
ncbi:MAG: CRISPR-associated protein Cas4 [Candidatus Altiarchaeota archaeon]